MAQSESAHIWDLMASIPMATLITLDGSHIDARPMAAAVKKDDGRIYILANKDEDSDREVRQDSEVVLSFAKGATFVVVYGEAQASDDRARIAELFNAFDKAWWDGPHDPRIRLIEIVPARAEYWESPGKLIAYADMLVSAATGKRPDAGDHGTVQL